MPKLEKDFDGNEIDMGEDELLPLPSAKVELADMVACARRLGLFSEILETTDLVLVVGQSGRSPPQA